MQTREQLYREALRKVQSRRQRATMLAQQKYNDTCRQIPQLPRLLADLNRNRAFAARYTLTGAAAQAEQCRRQADEAEQALQALLAENHLQLQQLDPVFTCPLCQDKGEFQGRTCQCVHTLVRQLRRKEISRISALELSHFDSFRLDLYPNEVWPDIQTSPRAHMAEILAYCKAYAAHFSLKNPNLLMTGTAGLGKTHLALAIANEALQKGADVIYISSRNLFDQLEREKYTPSSDLASTVQQAELLILDDLGTEYITPYGISFLYDLVNSRMLRQLPTIYTTNITREDMLRTRYTEKTASRLLGSCELLAFYGNDIRLLEK